MEGINIILEYYGMVMPNIQTQYDGLLAFIKVIYIIFKRLTKTGKGTVSRGGDISGLYMDDGYLFFRVDPVETQGKMILSIMK